MPRIHAPTTTLLSLSAIVTTAFLSLSACTPVGGGSTVEAEKATETVMGGLSLVGSNRSYYGGTPAASTFSAPGLSMTGSESTVGDLNTRAQTVVFSNYSDAVTGYTVSGTVSYTFVINYSTYSVSGTISSSNLSFSGGQVSSGTMNVSVSGGGNLFTETFGGTVTFDGITFDAAALSLEKAMRANDEALAAFSNGIGNIMNYYETGWTLVSGNQYTATGSPGVSMNGTKTGTDPVACDLTFVFTDYYMNGYTVNGTVSVVAQFGSSSSTGTVAASNLTFSWASVSNSQTWNATWTSAAAIAEGEWFNVQKIWTGTVNLDGRTFDAKTISF